jgi:pimeloyl-ACP methyl ester carboxylesterase
MTIYLLPGLGADHRLFSELSITGHRVVHITFPVPEPGQSMASYAKEISKQIDTSEKFILIGVSLGGMISCELATILHPHKVILISSARCNDEIPKLYKFHGRTGINRFIPGWVLKYSAILLQGIFENDGWNARKYFRAMIREKPAVYFKRTVNMIVNWERTESNPDIIHIHGSGDRTLPFKLVKPHHVVESGSHIMVYTRAKEVNKILTEVLAQI